MPDVTDIYRYIEQEAAPFTGKSREAAQASHNEAEFRTHATRHIEEVADKLDVDLLLREEYTLATGRADAVYNRLIIEYEPPGSLRPNLSHRHTAHAVDQVKDYIEGIAKKEKHVQDRLLGVAFDGHYYIFVRYREGHWYIEPPIEVNPASTARFLRSLFSLSSGRALIPENLVDDFGAANIYSQRVARALYHALEGHTDDLVGKLFQQWRLFFSEVSGYEEATDQLRDKKELRSFAKGMGLKPETTDPPRLFFTIHTYFSFLVKAIARLVLEQYAGGKLGTTPLTVLANTDDDNLHRELGHMEEKGGIFSTLGLTNLLEGDFFSWYLYAWDEEVADALRLALSRLAEYNPSTIEDDPYAARDLLKKLYHYLLPRELRHDLGEYYTPDWLAERVLRQLGEPLFVMPYPVEEPRRDFQPKRLLDPACGSGTFLILAIRAFKEHCLRQGLGEAETLELILNNIVGVDLNPLAVMGARVNYLLAIADLIPYRRHPIQIPVYLADSILLPGKGEDLFDEDRLIFKTVVGNLGVPASVDSREEMEALTNLLDECVSNEFSTEAFLARAHQVIEPMDAGAETVLSELYEHLRKLEKQGLNGIWVRVMKNAFMPLFFEQFDYIAGNPPWVNWESLPDGYRREIAPLWQKYALFPHKGFEAILGKSKDDISILMTYTVMDRFLKADGKLAFLITQSVFKTAGAGQGFRSFRIGADGPHLRVMHVDDMSELQPFEGASNRTAAVVLQKGRPTRYPVPYTYWKKIARGRGLDYESTLDEVQALTRRMEFHALPVSSEDPTSGWLTARRRALQAVRKILGPSDYDAHAGVYSGGANGVYWLDVLTRRPDNLLVVRNVTEGAKRKVDSITTEIEPDLIYPLLRGRDVSRWKAEPSISILVTHLPGQRLKAIPEEEMQRQWPKTWAYLKRFEKILLRRAALWRYFSKNVQKNQKLSGQEMRRLGKYVRYIGERTRRGQPIHVYQVLQSPYYSMFNIGDYSFKPWKVAWTRVGNDIKAVVINTARFINEHKRLLPLETAVLVPFDEKMESHYFCSAINSIPWRFTIISAAVHGTGGFGSPNILQKARILKYDRDNPIHVHLAKLSQKAHELAPEAYDGDEEAQEGLMKVEAEIDKAAAELWALTDEELTDIRKSFEELRG